MAQIQQSAELNRTPRDCTEPLLPNRLSQCTVPVCHLVSHTMTKIIKQKKKKINMTELRERVEQIKIKKANKRPTPFGDVGGTVGGAVSNFLFGNSAGRGIGRWLGTGIGSIFGSGDYKMIGPSASYNTLAGNIPKFSSTHATNIVCHREYLGDITGAAAFTNRSYPLNPGMATTFPWLSSVASNYQQYKFHGVIFEFRSLVTDFVTSGAPGTIVLTTNYNSDVPAYTSRQAAENAEYAVSTKPTESLVHMIECRPSETQIPLLNVRTGVPVAGQDLRLYDLGLAQVITQNNPSQVLGELWVSYCVELFKPVLGSSLDLGALTSFSTSRSGITAANPMGTVQVERGGDLGITITGTTVTITGLTVGVSYTMTAFWLTNTGTVTFNMPSIASLVGLTNYALCYNGGVAQQGTTGTSANVSAGQYNFMATDVIGLITWNADGTFGTNTTMSLKFNSNDPSIDPAHC